MADEQTPIHGDAAPPLADAPVENIPDAVAAAMFGVQRPASAGGWQPPALDQLQLSFAQYEIRGILGRGGMGAVYKGWHKSLERFVAIKVLPPAIDDGGMNFAERFKQEALAMAKFKHAGIVSVYDAGETPDGMLYFIMECVEGTDVAQLLAGQEKLAPAEALRITSRVCEALAYAHERGVIHRDIKPSNVMLEKDGTVKVADFGLAKLFNVDSHVNTMSSLSIGTPDFMPPEAFRGSRHVDHRGDIYAAGGLLYQMLTGKAPHGRFESASVVVPGLDKRLDKIIEKAMHADPEKRYASAGEFLADVERIGPAQRRIGGTGTQRVTGQGRRSLAMPVVAGLIVAGLLALVFFTLRTWRNRQTGTTAGAGAEAVEPRRNWRPAPSKFNAVMDRGAIHLQRFDTWGTSKAQDTNVAVRTVVAWQPPPGRNELIKVTARWTDTGHYYASLTGPNVELGHYRSPDVVPLQRWPLDPPPAPEEAISLQLACVGHRLAVWVRGRLVGVLDDETVTGPGKVGVQAVDGHFRSLESLDLDGLADAAAFHQLGLDPTGTFAIPSHDWLKVFPDLSKLPGLVESKDGWARLSGEDGIKHLTDPAGKELTLHNGGIRAQRRLPKDWHGGVLLHARSLDGGRRLNLCYYEPKAAGEKARLQLRQYRPETLPPNATAEQAWAAQKLLAEELIPPVSGEITTELTVVGSTVSGRIGDHIVLASVEDDGKAGRLALDEANTQFFREVGVLNLDGLPEAEALESAGMKAKPGQTAIARASLTQAGATKEPPATGAGTAGWRDAFAESPLKEVIAKAERTPQGYRLPGNNHWPISPRSQRAGAVRVHATSGGDKFVSLYVSQNDRQFERVRFVGRNGEWLLSHGAFQAAEADIAVSRGFSPLDGQPHELLFSRVAGRLRAMVDTHLILDAADPNPAPGTFVLDVFPESVVSVKKLEYLDLDGVPEAEALKLIGLTAAGKEMPAATGASAAPAKVSASKTEPWVDLLRPEAAASLQLIGIEKPGPEGIVIPANATATVVGSGGLGERDGALRFRKHFEPLGKVRVSLRARSTGGPAYGLMVLTESKVSLQVWRGAGIVDTLKVFELAEPLHDGQEYELELRAVGSTLTARLNGKTLGQIEDTTLPMGTFQLRAGKGDPAVIHALEYLDLSVPASAGASAAAPSPELLPATKDAPFVNTLGMKFVPVPITGGPTGGKRVLFSVWETRVQDYDVFVKQTQRALPKPKFEQGPAHPVVKVSWEDAVAFCAWLTEHEQKAGRLPAEARYRLPTDHEWSCAVGIGDREYPSIGPARNVGKLTDVFPWGTAWPPPQGAGNYSGAETAGHEMAADQKIIDGYRDDFSETAPVGSFSPNTLGIFDLGGNAWEWCEDQWKTGEPLRVVRGGSFGSASRSGLLSSYRDFNPPEARNSSFGFRVVIGPSETGAGAQTEPSR